MPTPTSFAARRIAARSPRKSWKSGLVSATWRPATAGQALAALGEDATRLRSLIDTALAAGCTRDQVVAALSRRLAL